MEHTCTIDLEKHVMYKQLLLPIHYQDIEENKGSTSYAVQHRDKSVQVEIDGLQMRSKSCTYSTYMYMNCL